MIPPLSIAHPFWWLPMLGLCFAHHTWSMHLDDRLCSKNRKHPDPRLLTRTSYAIVSGVILIIFYLGHLAVIQWQNVTMALVVWCAGYLLPTAAVARNIRNLRLGRLEYERIIQSRPEPGAAPVK